MTIPQEEQELYEEYRDLKAISLAAYHRWVKARIANARIKVGYIVAHRRERYLITRVYVRGESLRYEGKKIKKDGTPGKLVQDLWGIGDSSEIVGKELPDD